MIIGSLLGDGSLRCKRHALLEINHSIKQKEYVDWKYGILSNLVRTAPKPPSSNGSRVAYRFTTLSLPQLTGFYHQFYDGNRKRVPGVVLTPLALAVWFMDDGHKSYNAVYLNTQQFAAIDQLLLLDILKSQWGIVASLNSDKLYKRIRISVGSIDVLSKVILPYIRPESIYKLPSA